MNAKKPKDLKIQVAEGIKILEASVTVVRAADNVAEIKIGDSLDQKVNTAIPLTSELIEEIAKKVKNILGEQSSAVAVAGDSQFEGFIAQGIEAAPIITATTSGVISLNKSYLAGQQNKATIIHNIKNINIYQGSGSELHKNQPIITEEDIKKLTPIQLIKKLSIDAWILILVAFSIVATIAFTVGRYTTILQSSTINKETLFLEQLNSYQISFLKEIHRYQKTTGVNKVIVNRIGFIFDELTNKNTSINVSVNVLGNRADQTRFEDLVMSMPESFLKRLPSTRLSDPYVLTVTEEAHKLLDR